jgi:hypothetical protein
VRVRGRLKDVLYAERLNLGPLPMRTRSPRTPMILTCRSAVPLGDDGAAVTRLLGVSQDGFAGIGDVAAPKIAAGSIG